MASFQVILLVLSSYSHDLLQLVFGLPCRRFPDLATALYKLAYKILVYIIRQTWNFSTFQALNDGMQRLINYSPNTTAKLLFRVELLQADETLSAMRKFGCHSNFNHVVT